MSYVLASVVPFTAVLSMFNVITPTFDIIRLQLPGSKIPCDASWVLGVYIPNKNLISHNILRICLSLLISRTDQPVLGGQDFGTTRKIRKHLNNNNA